jgi:formylglycine-generating enzyme required for sulfatase activity
MTTPFVRAFAALCISTSCVAEVDAQTLFGNGCAGASGVTPTLAVVGPVKSGLDWILEITAPAGAGFGFLLVGTSNTHASTFGGLPLPLDLGGFFADPLWNGCELNVDPNLLIHPYSFDPTMSGGLATFVFPGFDLGTFYIQVVNVDADFSTRIAGVSQGLAVRRTAPDGMVRIEPGTFQMGSNEPIALAPYLNSNRSTPQHQVTLTQSFWIGRHEVTQQEFVDVMGYNPTMNIVDPARPADHVTWTEAMAYCALLTAAESALGEVPAGYEYRLPTDAEWEYACRAGSTTEFNVGAELTCSQAKFFHSNHTNADCYDMCPFTWPIPPCFFDSMPVAVGSYAPNAWGIHDMHGNVYEWCLDSYAPYSAASATDPFVTGADTKIFRGGAFGTATAACRSAYRNYYIGGNGANETSSQHGFRVVLAPIQVP